MHLILWPAVISLAITVLRLVGELQGWSKALFNAAPGGGGALIGISWLPILFGPWFAWKLAQDGKGSATPWKTAGLALLGIVVAFGSFGAVQALKLGVGAVMGAFLITLAAGFLPWKSWPELGKVLLGYALAARVPVVLVMLAAIYGSWGTHYDVLPPNPPPDLVAMGPLGRWFFIGLIPQLTIWIGLTMLVGALFGGAYTALLGPKRGAGR